MSIVFAAASSPRARLKNNGGQITSFACGHATHALLVPALPAVAQSLSLSTSALRTTRACQSCVSPLALPHNLFALTSADPVLSHTSRTHFSCGLGNTSCLFCPRTPSLARFASRSHVLQSVLRLASTVAMKPRTSVQLGLCFPTRPSNRVVSRP